MSDVKLRPGIPPHPATVAASGCLNQLLALTGALLIMAGGITVYPFIRDVLVPPPSSFGEAGLLCDRKLFRAQARKCALCPVESYDSRWRMQKYAHAVLFCT